MFAFYREMEQWMRNHYNNNDATFRPEWSKGWAFGPDKPYTDTPIINPGPPPDLPRRRPIERQLGHRQRRIQRVGSAQGLQQHLPGPVAALRFKY